jgi:uncharacterized protein YbjT (DUF2867 family)
MILVIGATGHGGRALVCSLASHGHDVVAMGVGTIKSLKFLTPIPNVSIGEVAIFVATASRT